MPGPVNTLRLFVVHVPTRLGSGLRVVCEDEGDDDDAVAAALRAAFGFCATARDRRLRLSASVNFMLVQRFCPGLSLE